MTNEQDEAPASDAVETAQAPEAETDEVDESKVAPDDRATSGPFDVTEVPAIRPYVDFGGIKVAPREGLQVRLEVNEQQQRVLAVTIEYQGSVLQIQAFAAPKSTGLWNKVRSELAKQSIAQGSQVREVDADLGGQELIVRPKGGGGAPNVQVARFVGVDGPRWMLRGVLLGKAAEDEAARSNILSVFREIVVVRGDSPMPPGELLPLQVPKGVQGATTQAGAPSNADANSGATGQASA